MTNGATVTNAIRRTKITVPNGVGEDVRNGKPKSAPKLFALDPTVDCCEEFEVVEVVVDD
jgi:hypothetical protein